MKEDELKEIIDEDWQFEVLENIFGDEEVSTMRRDEDTEYQVIVTLKRGKEVK